MQIEPSDFLVKQSKAELVRLQGELALHRGVLRDSRRHHWDSDRHWQVKQVESIRETKSNIAKAERELADFIKRHQWLIGDVPNSGRLCWHAYLGGMPIDTHYCILPEHHTGPHQNAIGKWNGLPKHPEPKSCKPIPSLIHAENLANLAAFGTDWGNRPGPSIIFYRDPTWAKSPHRRSYSCSGCRFLRFRDKSVSPLCAHPEMVKEYQVPQFVASGAKMLINARDCRALKEHNQNLTAPTFKY